MSWWDWFWMELSCPNREFHVGDYSIEGVILGSVLAYMLLWALLKFNRNL